MDTMPMDRPLTIRTGVVLAAAGTVISAMLGFGAVTAVNTLADHERRITRTEAVMDGIGRNLTGLDARLAAIDAKLDRAIERNDGRK